MSTNSEKYHSLSIAYGGFFETPVEQMNSKTPDKTFAAELAPVYINAIPAADDSTIAAPAVASAVAPAVATVTTVVEPQGSSPRDSRYTPQLQQVQGHSGGRRSSAIEISPVEFGLFCFLAGIATALIIVQVTAPRAPSHASLSA